MILSKLLCSAIRRHKIAVDILEGLGYDVPLMVPELAVFELNHSVDELVELAKGKSQLAGIQREGIVIRPIDETTDPELGRLSFKVINPDFLLKFGE